MSHIVFLKNGRALTSTRIIAVGCGIEHEAAVLLTKKYTDDLNDVGLSDLLSETFKTAGRAGDEAVIDEQQGEKRWSW